MNMNYVLFFININNIILENEKELIILFIFCPLFTYLESLYIH